MSEEDRSTEYGGDRPLVAVAGDSGFALRDTARWLHRRVERISHTERLMIRRRVSVDFTIPPGLPPFRTGEAGPNAPNIYFVPVALLRKWPPLMEFDLRAEDGRPIPLLTSHKNREVDAAALVDLAPAGNERDCMEPLLKNVAESDPVGAEKALQAVGTFLAGKWASLSLVDQRGWARTVRVAGSLVRNSILWVRVEAAPGDRQLIKFAYMEPAPRELFLHRRILAAFSWAPRRAWYELPNLGERASYHLEIEAPPDLAIYSARLELSDLPPRDMTQRPRRLRIARPLKNVFKRLWAGAASRRNELFGVASEGATTEPKHLRPAKPGEPYVWNARERAYLYVVGSQDQYGAASVDMGIGTRALITSSLRASLVITALLGFLWQVPGAVGNHADGAIALLIIFPPLLALLVFRSGEHPMMRQLISGVRFLLVLAAVLPVIDAAAVLGFAHPTASDLRTPFLIVFLLALLVSLLLVASWLLPPADNDY